MNILDLCIILFVLLGGIIGYKDGFTRTLVDLVGLVLIIILAFVLKNPVSEFLMLHGPFFDFYGLIKGVSVLNIAFYEILAFAFVFSILFILLKILTLATSIFEKILSFTGVLGIPSKILGFVLGLIKNYIIVFAVLFFLCLPNLADKEFVQNSKLKDPILEKTPVLSLFTEKSLKVFDEFAALKDKYEKTGVTDKFNYETLDLYLKYDIVKASLVEKLVQKNKLHVDGVEVLLEKYGD